MADEAGGEDSDRAAHASAEPAVVADGSEPRLADGGPNAFEDPCALELKEMGNEAYKQQDFQAAVDFWNRSIRRYVQEMEQGSHGHSLLSQESRNLEKSLYLNLAQGHLRVNEPGKALRACQVVLHDDDKNQKALYRGAEACLALGNFDQARGLLLSLLETDSSHAEGQRLLRRVQRQQQAGEKAATRKQKAMARAMCSGADFSEGRAQNEASANQAPSIAKTTIDCLARPEQMCRNLDIADAAAAAARRREARLAAAEPPQAALPEPTTTSDLDVFRDKVFARTRKYQAHIEKSRKLSSDATRAVRLDWLRGGGKDSGPSFEDLEASWKQEMRAQVLGQERLAEQEVVEEGQADGTASEGLGFNPAVARLANAADATRLPVPMNGTDTCAAGMEEMD